MGKASMGNGHVREGIQALEVMLENRVMSINGEVETGMRLEGRDTESMGWRQLTGVVMGIVGKRVVIS